MRLWHALVVTAFFSLACANMDEMTGGGDDAEETTDGDETEDDAEEGEDEDTDAEEEDEEEVVKVEKECTVQAFKAANGASKLKGSLSAPKCAGRWGAVDTSGGRALLEFNNGWTVKAVGSCNGPTTRVCQVLGYK